MQRSRQLPETSRDVRRRFSIVEWLPSSWVEIPLPPSRSLISLIFRFIYPNHYKQGDSFIKPAASNSTTPRRWRDEAVLSEKGGTLRKDTRRSWNSFSHNQMWTQTLRIRMAGHYYSRWNRRAGREYQLNDRKEIVSPWAEMLVQRICSPCTHSMRPEALSRR